MVSVSERGSITFTTILIVALVGLGPARGIAWGQVRSEDGKEVAPTNERPGPPSPRDKREFRRRHFDSAGRFLAPEVLELSSSETLPASVFKKYDSRTLGESIVARIAQTRWPVDLFGSSVYAPGELVKLPSSEAPSIEIYVPSRYVRDILREPNGAIRNAHEVPHGEKTPDYRSQRIKTENKLSGIQLAPSGDPREEAELLKLRPKSAVLGVEFEPTRRLSISGAERFGEVGLIMKPEVAKRTSYTPYDSMSVIKGEDVFPERAYLEVRALSDEGTYVTSASAQTEYYEAHIWGELDLRDVQEWRIPSDLDPGLLAELRATGIPVYSYREHREHGRYVRVRDRLISPGDPLKLQALEDSLKKSRFVPDERSLLQRPSRPSRDVQLAEALRRRAPLRETLSWVSDPAMKEPIIRNYASRGVKEALNWFVAQLDRSPEGVIGAIAESLLRGRLLRYPPFRSKVEWWIRTQYDQHAGDVPRDVARATIRLREEGRFSPAFEAWAVASMRDGSWQKIQLVTTIRCDPTDRLRSSYVSLLGSSDPQIVTAALRGIATYELHGAPVARAIAPLLESPLAHLREDARRVLLKALPADGPLRAEVERATVAEPNPEARAMIESQLPEASTRKCVERGLKHMNLHRFGPAT